MSYCPVEVVYSVCCYVYMITLNVDTDLQILGTLT
jgi:hypothetical protein